MGTVEYKTKPKFNKDKCLKCKYHSKQLSGGYQGKGEDGKNYYVHCNYSKTGQTCLIDTGFDTYDMRGEDYNDCKLFKEGNPHDD